MYPRTFFKQIVISACQNSRRFKHSCHGLKLPLDSLPSHKWIPFSRTSSTTSGNAICVKYESLLGRALVRLSGDGIDEYLQGLITNDINHLQNAPSLYTMFLNTKGRILFDSIIYKYNDILLVECDIQEVDSFVRHLKMYQVRRKIAIDNVTDVFSVGVVYNPKQNLTKNCDLNGTIKDLEQLVPCTTIYEHDSSFEQTVKDILIDKKNVFVYRDPRLSTLGVRLIHSKEVDIRSFIEQKYPNQPDWDTYVTIRYKLGVAEGIDEIPLGNSFPHEYNCDYLHGVSFHKGCYIGQELTARTQHTGVVRKRIMPLYFEETLANSLEKDSILEDSDRLVKVNIGKLRGVHDKYGVALLRIAEALKVSKLKVKNVLATTTKPAWWPIEASKSVTKATDVS